jgi:hypothetical protein
MEDEPRDAPAAEVEACGITILLHPPLDEISRIVSGRVGDDCVGPGLGTLEPVSLPFKGWDNGSNVASAGAEGCGPGREGAVIAVAGFVTEGSVASVSLMGNEALVKHDKCSYLPPFLVSMHHSTTASEGG